jgi:DNA-binding NarL/FixJ family response regulator
MVRILIVDDHDLVRNSVRHIVEARHGWDVVGEASNGKEALNMICEVKPDAVVMDLAVPVMNGLEATTEITRRNLGCEILIFTAHENVSLFGQVQRAAAEGLVTKSKATSELTPALEAIIAGQTHFD